MKNYTHIAWDFNGTILNDLDASLSAANALLAQYSLPTLPDLNAYREVFGFPVINYYRRIGFDFDRIPYSVLAPEWVAYYKRFAANATYFLSKGMLHYDLLQVLFGVFPSMMAEMMAATVL